MSQDERTTLMTPEVRKGVSTYLGVALAVLGFAATVVAGATGSPVSTIVGGAGTLGTFVALFGLRAAQAIALARAAAEAAAPALAAGRPSGSPAVRTMYVAPDPETVERLERIEEALERLLEDRHPQGHAPRMPDASLG